MTIATAVEADGDRAVVVKLVPLDRADRLRAEGERLRRAAHPGVVEVVRSGPSGDRWELRTVHAGRPLSVLGTFDVARAAAVVAGVASTLADLHQQDVVHGRIDASHVLLGEQGRPVLCGLGDGLPPACPEDDVAGLGALLTELIGDSDAGEPIPERRWAWRRSAWSGWDRRALLLLADQACAEPPTRRPTARRLAAAIADAVPAMAPEGQVAAGSRRPPATGDVDTTARLRSSRLVSRGDRAPRRVAIGAGIAALVVVGALGIVVVDDPAGTVSKVDRETQQVGATVPGSEVVADGRRFRVGQPGDEILVDDWDCDGVPTPALLRPSSGEVYVFPRWAEGGELSVGPTMQVLGAEMLVGETTTSGCVSLSVRTHDGDLVPVLEGAER